MSRAREPQDFVNGLAEARPLEGQVNAALVAHLQISHLVDYTAEVDTLDFRSASIGLT